MIHSEPIHHELSIFFSEPEPLPFPFKVGLHRRSEHDTQKTSRRYFPLGR